MIIVRVLWMFQPCCESFCMHVCHKLPFNYWPIFFGLSSIFFVSLSPEFSLRPFCNVNLIVSSWSTSFTVSILHPLRCHSSSFCGTKKFKKKNNSTWWYDSNNTNDDVIPKFLFWLNFWYYLLMWTLTLEMTIAHRGNNYKYWSMSNDLILQPTNFAKLLNNLFGCRIHIVISQKIDRQESEQIKIF